MRAPRPSPFAVIRHSPWWWGCVSVGFVLSAYLILYAFLVSTGKARMQWRGTEERLVFADNETLVKSSRSAWMFETLAQWHWHLQSEHIWFGKLGPLQLKFSDCRDNISVRPPLCIFHKVRRDRETSLWKVETGPDNGIYEEYSIALWVKNVDRTLVSERLGDWSDTSETLMRDLHIEGLVFPKGIKKYVIRRGTYERETWLWDQETGLFYVYAFRNANRTE